MNFSITNIGIALICILLGMYFNTQIYTIDLYNFRAKCDVQCNHNNLNGYRDAFIPLSLVIFSGIRVGTKYRNFNFQIHSSKSMDDILTCQSQFNYMDGHHNVSLYTVLRVVQQFKYYLSFSIM